MRARSLLAVVMAGGLLVAAGACGDSDDDDAAATTTTAAASAGITVSDAWCRTSPAMATAGACYMLIENGSGEADALVDASVPTSVAAKTEIHETVEAGAEGTMDTGTTMGEGAETEAMAESEGEAMDDQTAGTTEGTMGSGMMEMREVDQIDLPAGETVSLEPGGYHIMLLELPQPLATGSMVAVTLEFERAPQQTVQAEVRES